MPLQQRFDLRRREIIACLAVGLVYGSVVGWWASPVAGGFSACLLFMMSLITLIDLRHFTIPDVLSLPAIPLGVAASMAAVPADWRETALDRCLAILLAGAALYLLRWAFYKLRGVIGLGLGDVKLGAAAGAWVGLAGLHWTLLLASLSALTAVIIQSKIAGRSRIPPSTKVPFGSFIAPAIIIMWTVMLLSG